VLKIEELADWLETQLPAGTVIRCNVMPDEGPNSMVVLNEISGLQSQIEDALDTPVVKVRSRGSTAVAARDLSHRVDRALVDAKTPISFGTTLYILALGRFGGPPWPSGVDREERTQYECNYFATVLR
jgi:hypothetical protein